jgi:hypothetical protein
MGKGGGVRGRRDGGRGRGERAAAWQQLSTLYFISQIIKDDYPLPF